MKQTPEHIQGRVTAEQKKAIASLAEHFDGNTSMALRRVIERGLRELEREQRAKQVA